MDMTPQTAEQAALDKAHEEAFDAYFEELQAEDEQKREDAFCDAYEQHIEDMCCPDY